MGGGQGAGQGHWVGGRGQGRGTGPVGPVGQEVPGGGVGGRGRGTRQWGRWAGRGHRAVGQGAGWGHWAVGQGAGWGYWAVGQGAGRGHRAVVVRTQSETRVGGERQVPPGLRRRGKWAQHSRSESWEHDKLGWGKGQGTLLEDPVHWI